MSRGLASETIRCPTCRAAQDWSDACRRCKCDLRLLRAVAEAYDRSRRACLEAIDSGDPQAAARHARRCNSLHPDSSSRRLLALAALLQADWPAAAALAARDD